MFPTYSMKTATDLSDQFLTEDAVLDWLKIQKGTLDQLRYRQKNRLSYVQINQNLRLYYVPDLYDWLLQNRRGLKNTNSDFELQKD